MSEYFQLSSIFFAISESIWIAATFICIRISNESIFITTEMGIRCFILTSLQILPHLLHIFMWIYCHVRNALDFSRLSKFYR